MTGQLLKQLLLKSNIKELTMKTFIFMAVASITLSACSASTKPVNQFSKVGFNTISSPHSCYSEELLSLYSKADRSAVSCINDNDE